MFPGVFLFSSEGGLSVRVGYRFDLSFSLFLLIPSLFKFVFEFVCHVVEVGLIRVVLKYLFVSPFAMPFLVPGGWYDLIWMYNCLLVFEYVF